MSETQARWFSELTLGNVSLPGVAVMNKIIDKDIVSAESCVCMCVCVCLGVCVRMVCVWCVPVCECV